MAGWSKSAETISSRHVEASKDAAALTVEQWNDHYGSRVAARAIEERSSANGHLQRPVSSERRKCGLVGSTVIDDLQWRLGQPERLRQQRSIWEVEHPDLKLECQVVERSQDSAVCRFSNCLLTPTEN